MGRVKEVPAGQGGSAFILVPDSGGVKVFRNGQPAGNHGRGEGSSRGSGRLRVHPGSGQWRGEGVPERAADRESWAG
jgi:hypothetical protein